MSCALCSWLLATFTWLGCRGAFVCKAMVRAAFFALPAPFQGAARLPGVFNWTSEAAFSCSIVKVSLLLYFKMSIFRPATCSVVMMRHARSRQVQFLFCPSCYAPKLPSLELFAQDRKSLAIYTVRFSAFRLHYSPCRLPPSDDQASRLRFAPSSY